MSYRFAKKPKRRQLLFYGAIAVAILLLVGVGTAVYIRQQYQNNLQPASSSLKTQYFTVENGQTAKQIATNLEQAGLIRSASAFEWYVRSNEYRDKLQAGTYILSPSLTTQQIVEKMVKGDISKNLLTILPGKTLKQIKKTFSDAGYSQNEIEEAFDPATHASHPALVSLPKGASLEGYLYPDSFEKTDQTPASSIVRASLNEMAERLTPDLQASIAKQGLSVRQAIILASIILQESGNPNDQKTISQVFLKRLAENIALQSDPTAVYASSLAGVEPDLSIDSPYNTYAVKGLPPGPIGNVTGLALEAVASPTNTDYLFFVAGDDGTTHFSRTLAEHEQNIDKYCTTLCGN